MSENAITTTDLKKHFNNLINALVALCPSHNYVSQFVTFLPEEYAVIYDGFPEFLGDRGFREQVQVLLGLNLGPKIEAAPGSFGRKLQQIIALALEILNDDGQLEEWSEFLKDVREEGIVNPQKEWVRAKVKAAVSDPDHGKVAREVLNALMSQHDSDLPGSGELLLNPSPPDGLSIDALQRITQVAASELAVTLNWLEINLKLIQPANQSNQSEVEVSGQKTYQLNPTVKVDWLSNL